MKNSLALHRFPAFCGIVVGGFILLQKPFQSLYHSACIFLIKYNGQRWAAQRLEIAIARFLAAFVSAWLSLPLLNAPRRVQKEALSTRNGAEDKFLQPEPIQQAGKTIDLTLFMTTRALEAVIVNAWRHRSRQSSQPPSGFSKMLSHHADTALFVASCSTIMWSWFYYPEALPRTYNKWINSAAQVDPRLIEILRLARQGKFVYGEDKGSQARQCEGMCRAYGWPIAWGDPQRTVPLPCEIVHMGAGPSCHWHACVRFARSFKFAMATNLPLQLFVRIISKRGRLYSKDAVQIVTESARSSAFLGGFIALFYYGICLSRTQLGPRLVSESTISRQDWDSGLCVRVACALCGWSVLIEKERRRGELAMFVAPRAAATFLPRRYDRVFFWRERAAFSFSLALLFTLAQQDPRMIRGVFGRLLSGVLG